jgi:photosystem II stability/assembly factor-like uncharacterized protein
MRHPLLLLLALVPIAARAQGWDGRPTGADAEYRALAAVSGSVAWVAGSKGTIALTTDGGRRWSVRTVPGAESLFFTGIHASDARTAVAVGTNFGGAEGRIYRTTDGGAHWSEQWRLAAPGVFLDGLAFWDDAHGIAFGDPIDGAPFILTTDDGGRTWARVAPERLPRIEPGEAAFAASGEAIAVAGDRDVWIGTGGSSAARVWHSADRARTWTIARTPIAASKTAGIFGLAFADARHGVAVGGDYARRAEGGEVALTSDGGATWTLVGPPAPAGVRYGVALPAPPGARGEAALRRIVAVAPGGSGYSCDAGRGWVAADTLSLNTVRVARDGSVWGAGVRGRAVVWRDGFACPTETRPR